MANSTRVTTDGLRATAKSGLIEETKIVGATTEEIESGAVSIAEESGNITGEIGRSTVWSRIKGTADKMPGTEIPATFRIDLAEDIKYVNPTTGTNTLWTNANATEHMKEYVGRFGKESWSIGVRSQTMLDSYSKALDEAMRNLITLQPGEHEITCCGWEFAVNTLTGIVYHARLL